MFAVHEKAVQVAKDLLHAEVILPSYLQEIERDEIYRKVGYANMHEYCTVALKLSKNQTYTYLGGARKCVRVPELQEALESGEINTDMARRLLPIIDKVNPTVWISLAQEVSRDTLDKEVALENAKINPKSRIREKMKPIAENLLEFRSAIDLETEELLKRCKELMCQKSKTAAKWNLVLKQLAQEFIKKNDPVKKAERNAHKETHTNFTGRRNSRYIPASLRHLVSLRDQGKCQALLPDGTKCNCALWIEIHHIIPLSEGGTHTLENLMTLCGSHHAFQHSDIREPWRRNSALAP